MLPDPINMKIVHISEEIVLSAADHDLMGRIIAENGLHINITEDFYGNSTVKIGILDEAIEMCTIGNFVGEKSVGRAVKMGAVDPDNIITIAGVPHAQFARMR